MSWTLQITKYPTGEIFEEPFDTYEEAAGSMATYLLEVAAASAALGLDSQSDVLAKGALSLLDPDNKPGPAIMVVPAGRLFLAESLAFHETAGADRHEGQ
jgi:hypothetical protein